MDREKIVKILHPLISMAYDLEQTKPKMDAQIDQTVADFEAFITARVVSELEKVKTEHTTTHKYFNCVEYLDNRIATLSPYKGRRE